MDGVTTAHRVCDLQLAFARTDRHGAYAANFKLQGAESRIGALVTEIQASGTVRPAEGYSDAALPGEAIDGFFRCIDKRVRKLQQEQAVQNVTFLGNRFRLHGTTIFTVVSDDEGLLGIEIHRGRGRQTAQMMAGNLLDGLYDGSIELLPVGKS